MAILTLEQNQMALYGSKMNLTQPQLTALCVLAQKGDEKAKTLLARSQAPLCAKLAHRWGADAQEVFQVAISGVAEAIATYSPMGGASFTTWVMNKIRGEMTRFLRTKNLVGIPENRKLELLRIAKQAQKDGIDPLDLFNEEQKEDWEAMKLAPTQLSTPLGEKGTIEDTLAAPQDEFTHDDKDLLETLLATLSDDDRAFVMECANSNALEASAKRGLGRETGRKKYVGAIDKMAKKWEQWARA